MIQRLFFTALVLSTSLPLTSLWAQSANGTPDPLHLCHLPDGTDLCAGADLGRPQDLYQGQKDWWSQDIVSAFFHAAIQLTANQIHEACLESNCVNQIKEICREAQRDNEWNPFSLELKLAESPISLTVDPVKLCNYPGLR